MTSPSLTAFICEGAVIPLSSYPWGNTGHSGFIHLTTLIRTAETALLNLPKGRSYKDKQALLNTYSSGKRKHGGGLTQDTIAGGGGANL